MNKLLERSAKTIKPATKPAKPARPSGSGLAQSRRVPVWRQGTLVLVP